MSSSPLGLLAGKGKFPLLLAQEAKKNGRDLVVIALKEEMDENLAPYAKSVQTISVSKLESILQALKKEGVEEVIMAGRVQHVRLFSDFIPDFRTTQLLLRIKDRRADTILSAVSEELKKEGMTLLPSTTYLSHLLPEPGLLTKRPLQNSEEKNVEFGIPIAMGIAALDIGQTVVVRKRSILAVEALEGTDACIRRAAQLGGDNMIVIKTSKPHQDLRFDMPVIGCDTIQVLAECRSKVLAIEARKTLILEREKCIAKANEMGLSIIAWERKA